jgi:TetR/AcrR family transcriptional repressor of uid operon
VAGRTAKSDARREEILQAAGSCFSEKGFRGCGVSDICAKLGISPGHLYYYFKSKDAILAALLDRRRELSVREIRALGDQPGALRILLDTDHLAELNSRPANETYMDAAAMWEAYAEAARGGEIADLAGLHWDACGQAIRDLLVKAKARGEVRADADIDRMMILVEMFVVTTQLAERISPSYRKESYHDAGVAMLAPYLVTPEATSRPGPRRA